jgi:membrane-associated HD superfamily phosphohydrolase
MSKFLYIIIGILFICCNNTYNNESLKVSDVAEESVEATEAQIDLVTAEELNRSFTVSMVQQKLQELADLEFLIHQHPEFKEEIKNELDELSKDDIQLTREESKAEITNVQQIDEAQKINDSVTEIKLSFDIVSDKSTRKDTLFATLITKMILLDGLEKTASKISFRRTQNQ